MEQAASQIQDSRDLSVAAGTSFPQKLELTQSALSSRFPRFSWNVSSWPTRARQWMKRCTQTKFRTFEFLHFRSNDRQEYSQTPMRSHGDAQVRWPSSRILVQSSVEP